MDGRTDGQIEVKLYRLEPMSAGEEAPPPIAIIAVVKFSSPDW